MEFIYRRITAEFRAHNHQVKNKHDVMELSAQPKSITAQYSYDHKVEQDPDLEEPVYHQKSSVHRLEGGKFKRKAFPHSIKE